MAIHDHTDPDTGQPLCPDRYDYIAHLIWQWWAPEPWRRFTIALRRKVATRLGLLEAAARELVRVKFAKTRYVWLLIQRLGRKAGTIPRSQFGVIKRTRPHLRRQCRR